MFPTHDVPDSNMGPSPLATPFECSLGHRDADSVSLHVTGELDIANSPTLGVALEEALLTAPLVILDLRAVTFIDSAGAHVIGNAYARARSLGVRLLIANGSQRTDRFINLAATIDEVDLRRTSSCP